MISESQYIYYLGYAALCVLLGISYFKVKSTEGLTITTKEFKLFQTTFLSAYGIMILGETIAAASFYRTLINIGIKPFIVVKLYLVTIVSTTIFNIILEIIDMGTRKTKCILSSLLFAISMFTLYFRGSIGLYMLGRVIYGAANSLLHNAFNSYLVQQHTAMGFPDDWLTHTFGILTHTMALVTAISGFLGQAALGGGTFGAVTLALVLFISVGFYISKAWESDFSSNRIMFGPFSFSMNQTFKVLQESSSSRNCLLLSACAESSIFIFLFYWALSMDMIARDQGDVTAGKRGGDIFPDAIVYSSYLIASIVGTYLSQMLVGDYGESALLQFSLSGGSIFYFLYACTSSTTIAFTSGILVNLTIGAYWALINLFRNKYTEPHVRDGCTSIGRIIACSVSVIILTFTYHSVLFTLLACSILTGVAGYLEYYVSNYGTPVDDVDALED